MDEKCSTCVYRGRCPYYTYGTRELHVCQHYRRESQLMLDLSEAIVISGMAFVGLCVLLRLVG